jgi:urease accessory protein
MLTASGTLFAHPGHDVSGFAAGVVHPFNGIDHLLAMVAIGLWAVTLGGTAMWRVPGAFVVMLVAGAVIGMSGVQLVQLEPIIALSLLLVGLAITFALRVPNSVGVLLAGIFSLFHGNAHGIELLETTSGYMYLLGIASTSITLHIAGIGLGITLRRYSWLLRSSGAAIAGIGMWMVVAL